MKKNRIDEYIQKGQYGVKSFLTAHDADFLGTFKERCLLAWCKERIYSGASVIKVQHALKKRPDTILRLNAQIPLKILHPYIQCAQQLHKPYLLVQSNLKETSFGLVVSASEAVDISEQELS